MRDIQSLLDIMKTLRDPDNGCPWDLEQTFASIAPYTLEEAYEVVDAIEHNDMEGLRDELGDLLLQVVFHAQMAKEQSSFEFADVVEAICSKMTRRHPHVFGSEKGQVTSDQVRQTWQDIKQQEKPAAASVLDGIPNALPALKLAQKTGSRAAGTGFDWPDPQGPMDKVDEELRELKEAVSTGSAERIEDEMGDVLFSLVNVCRHQGVDAETALRRTITKFHRRFRIVEEATEASGKTLNINEMEAVWQQAKGRETPT